MKAKKIECYECPECGSLYEEEMEARECCITIDAQEGWQCSECDEIYLDKDEAKECCR